MNSLVILLAAAISMAVASSYDYYQCKPCRGEECDLIPEGCLYGMTRDPCGRMSCKTGPGQRCGGRDNHLGKCGDGLRCLCGKCKGCSIDRLKAGIIECDNSPVCSTELQSE